MDDGNYNFTMPASNVIIEASFAKIKVKKAEVPEKPDTTYTGGVQFVLGTPGLSGIILNPASMPFLDVYPQDWFYYNVEYMWKHYLRNRK